MWNIIIKNNKVNFILCIIFFIIGYINLLINTKLCRIFRIDNIFIGFIPFLVAIFLLTVSYNGIIKLRIMKIINIVFFILSIILLTINFAKLIVNETFEINNDVKNYERTIKLYDNKEIEHFPYKIAEDAENVEFEEWAPFMQGGSGLYLSYDINRENQGKIDKELRNKSKYVLESLEEIKVAGENIYFLDKIKKSIGYKSYPDIEGSDDFIIYILEATKTSEDRYWNHGIEKGVIVNRDKNRVIYFIEQW